MAEKVWRVAEECLTHPDVLAGKLQVSIVDVDGGRHPLIARTDDVIRFCDAECHAAFLQITLDDHLCECPVDAESGVVGYQGPAPESNTSIVLLDDEPLLARVDRLQRLPDVRHLIVFGHDLTHLAPLKGLAQLKSLRITWCQVTDLTALAGLTQLSSLYLGGCAQVTDLTPLAGLPLLTSLHLWYCEKVKDLTPLAGMPQLTALTLKWCEQVTDLAPLSPLGQLTSLDLLECEQVTDLTPLAGLKQLAVLNLKRCKHVADLTPLAPLTQLTALGLVDCEQVTDLTPLGGLAQLTALDLGMCRNVVDVTPLARLAQLTSLNLTECEQVRDLTPLAGLSQLETLDLSRCRKVDLTPLAGLSRLNTLDLEECDWVEDLTFLAGMAQLTTLRLKGCAWVRDLAPIMGSTRLTSLDLGGCLRITLTPLAGLAQLKTLDLSGCRQLTDLIVLAGLTQLTSLYLRGCSQISDLTPLIGLAQLTTLDLDSCKNVTDVSPLAGLTRLETLDLTNCSRVVRVQPLASARSLSALDLSGCGNVRDLDTLADLPSLRKLTWVSRPAATAVLAACACTRGDAPHIRDHCTEWIEDVHTAASQDLLVTRLARALAVGGAAAWAANAFGALVDAAQRRGDVGHGTWQELFTQLRQSQGAATCERLFTHGLQHPTPPDRPPHSLAAALEAMSALPPDAVRWSRPLADVSLARATSDTARRHVAPAAALFYRSIGDDLAVTHWLDLATDPDTPVWRDRVLASLARWDVAHDDARQAQARLRDIRTPSIRDEVRASIARAYARSAPRDAAAALLAIEDDTARSNSAQELATVAEFTESPEQVEALLLGMQHDPERLAALLQTVLERHPAGATARAIGAEFGGVRGDSLGAALDVLLGEDVLRRNCDEADLSAIAREVGSPGRASRELLVRGLLGLLESRGMITKRKRKELLVQLVG